MAISLLYNPMPTRLFEADGDFASGAQAFFYLARTTTPLVVYTDSPLAVSHTWPVIADAYGLLPPVYLATGTEYKVRIEDALGSILYAADGIANPLLDDAGSGGGSSPVSESLFQTGYFDWQPIIGERVGWVRANGKTISSATGTGDTANDDCQALFAFLWNTFAQEICPVQPSGRGANPAADWAAGKSIVALDMRGRSAVGLADMGASTGIGSEVNTTGQTISGNVLLQGIPGGALTLGICAGMSVIGAGIPVGAKVAQVTGAGNVNLTIAATASASGVALRFSMFDDARVAGSPGGESTHRQTLDELASHTHAASASGTASTSQASQGALVSSVSDPGHLHGITTNSQGVQHTVLGRTNPGGTFAGPFAGGPTDGYTALTVSSIESGTGISVSTSFSAYPTFTTTITGVSVTNVAAGSSVPSNLWTPARVGTWFIKK